MKNGFLGCRKNLCVPARRKTAGILAQTGGAAKCDFETNLLMSEERRRPDATLPPCAERENPFECVPYGNLRAPDLPDGVPAV
jgi:hypothetical protein